MKNDKRLAFILVSLLCLGATWYCQSPKIFDQYAFTGDLRANVYWMERARNPERFKDDLLADFNSAFANPLLIGLYRVTDFLDIKLVSELLAFPLCWITVFFLFRLGYAIKGTPCAFWTSLLFILFVWYEPEFDYFGVGNAGDFVLPLTAAFLYYFYSKNSLAMAIVLLLQAFFYPPIFLICLFCFLWTTFSRFQTKKLVILLIVVAFSFPTLFSSKHKRVQKFGETYTLKEMKNMEEFRGNGGRLPLLYPNISERIFNDRSGIGRLDGSLGPLLILFFLFLFVFIVIKKKPPGVDPPIMIVFIVSVLFFVAANVFMLKLFEPSRYMLFTLPLILILLISKMFSEIVGTFSHIQSKIILSIVFVFFGFFLFPIGPQYRKINDAPLFQFIASLPQDSFIAGDPFIMDDIPLLSKRKVYLSHESSLPYFRKYNEEIRRRTLDLFKAYYCRSFNDLLEFSQRNKIDYFVVRPEHFLRFYSSEGEAYNQPYHAYIERLIARGGPFALENVPAHYKIYEDPQFVVIKVN